MTFDEAFEREASALFAARGPLEVSIGSGWEPLRDDQLIALAFQDKGRAKELAAPHGLRLSDGRSVRFRLPT